MEKDNPFNEFGPVSAKQSSSSKSNEESTSEGGSSESLSLSAGVEVARKRKKSIFSLSKKDKNKDKDKDKSKDKNKTKDKDKVKDKSKSEEKSKVKKKLTDDLEFADDSKSNGQSEEVVKVPNRSMSDASSLAAVNVRARLLQEVGNGAPTSSASLPGATQNNSSSRSTIVISPRRTTGPRIANGLSTWTRVASSDTPGFRTPGPIRSRSASIATQRVAPTLQKDELTASTKSPLTPTGMRSKTHTRSESLEGLRQGLPSDSNPLATLSKGDGQTPWMTTTPSSLQKQSTPTVDFDWDSSKKQSSPLPYPSINTMVAPGTVQNGDARARQKIQESVRQALNAPPSPPIPSHAKITIQENMYRSRGMPTVTIETGSPKNNTEASPLPLFQTEATLAAVLPFPELNHIPASNSNAKESTQMVNALLNAVLPGEEESLLQSIMGAQRTQTPAANITSLIVDSALNLDVSGEKQKGRDTISSIFDAIEAKNANQIDEELSDSLEREIQEANMFILGASTGESDDESTSSSSSSSSSPRPLPPPHFSKTSLHSMHASVSMPSLPKIPEPVLKRPASSEALQSPKLNLDDELIKLQVVQPTEEKQQKSNPPSVANRLSRAGVLPPLNLNDFIQVKNQHEDERAEVAQPIREKEEKLARVDPPLPPPSFPKISSPNISSINTNTNTNTNINTKKKSRHRSKSRHSSTSTSKLEKETAIRFQRLTELIQAVHKSSQRQHERTNAYVKALATPIESLMEQSNQREQKIMQTQHRFLELLKTVSTSLSSIQGPQQSLRTTLEQSSKQNRGMFEAMLTLLQSILHSVSHYQEELKVIRAVSNKQALDHAQMMEMFQTRMQKTDELVEATKAKYKGKSNNLKVKLKVRDQEITNLQNLNQALLQTIRSGGQEVMIEMVEDPPVKQLTSSNHHHSHHHRSSNSKRK